MENSKSTLISAKWYQKIIFILFSLGLTNSVIAIEYIKVHDHMPPGDLTVSALAGKAMKYEYVAAVSVTPYGAGEYEAISYGETIDLVFAEEKCTHLGLEGKFKGQTETQACGQREIAPGVYFVTWLESSGQVVSMVINTKSKTVNASYLSKGPRGLDNLEFLHAEIHNFGTISEIKALRK